MLKSLKLPFSLHLLLSLFVLSFQSSLSCSFITHLRYLLTLSDRSPWTLSRSSFANSCRWVAFVSCFRLTLYRCNDIWTAHTLPACLRVDRHLDCSVHSTFCITIMSYFHLTIFYKVQNVWEISPSVLWYCWLGHLTCKNRRPYNLYCVGADVKPCLINWEILRHWYDFRYFSANFDFETNTMSFGSNCILYLTSNGNYDNGMWSCSKYSLQLTALKSAFSCCLLIWTGSVAIRLAHFDLLSFIFILWLQHFSFSFDWRR